MRRFALFAVLVFALSLSGAALAWANTTAQTLPFSQAWTDTNQVSRNNNWDSVPGINGYSGDITFTAGSDPQGMTADGAALGLNVTANQGNPNTNTSGGVAEFDRSPTTNPVVALQPTDTHDLPHLVMNLDTRSKKNVNVSYLLRDIDGSADNAAQQMVLQYRVGSSGNYTNLPAGYVADATTGPSLATKTTPVGVNLPAAAENQALVQVRVGAANAVGTDEWVGVDDVKVSSAPGVSITGPATANEGTTQTYDYAVSDTDSGDTFTVKGNPDCGTGGNLVGTPTKTATGGSFQCRFPDGPASSDVRVQVTDSRGLDSNTASRAVSVSNVAPTVALSGPTTANEGETKSYDFTVTDPGQDTFAVKGGFPDCGTGGTLVSGSLSTTATGGSFGCRFPDGPANPGVRLQVSDSDGAESAVASRNVTVGNVAPAVSLSGPAGANEGETKAYDFTVTDPGQDAFTVRNGFPDCAGGNQSVAGSLKTTASGGSFECRFADGPTSPAVRMQVADEDGGNSNVASRSVTVANVAPAVELSGPPAADEGQTKTYAYSVADPGDDPNPTITESCGQNGVRVDTPAADDFRCRFPDGPASSTVSVTADDGDGTNNTGSGSVAVQVSNVAPTAILTGDGGADEGQTKSYAFEISDPGDDTAGFAQGSPRCGENGRLEGTPTVGDRAFRCAFPDGPATTTAAVRVVDSDGAEGDTASREVIVANVAPTVTLKGPGSTDEGRTETYAYSVADPGTDPDPSVAEDCGQGARKAGTPRENSFDCAFPDGPASPTVNVSATDEDGAGGEASRSVAVANVAPTAGDDPAEGAYETDEDAALSAGAGRGLLANDADRGADGLTAGEVSGPAHGTVEVSGDGSFVYRPNDDYNGEDSFTYEACDEDGACSPAATASIRVAAVNDAPVNGVPGSQKMEEDTSLVFSGANGNAITVSDPDAERLGTSVEATGGTLERGDVSRAAAEGGGSAVTAEGTAAEIEAALDGLRFVPEANSNGAASLRVITDDGGRAGSGGPLKDEDTVDIGVTPVNDAPEISDIQDAATDEDAPTDPIPFTVRDVDTPAGDLTLSGTSGDPELVPDSGIEFGGTGEDRTVRVNPAADRFGKAEITVEVDDGSETASDAFVLTVRDRTPPDTPTVDLEAGSDTGSSNADDVTGDPTPVFFGEAEAGSEVALFDGEDRIANVTAGDGGWRYAVPGDRAFDDGRHRITATATDGAGNESEVSAALNLIVDRSAPDTDIDGSPHDPTNGTTAAFRFHADEEDATFECFVDDGDFVPCSSPQEYAEVSEGRHAFEVRATDRAGNTDPSPAMREWTVDTRAPSVSLTEPAEDALVRGEVRIAADADDDRELGKVEFLVDGEVLDVDRGVAADRDEPYEFGWDTTLEEDGEHSVEVRATDAAGNAMASGARAVRVDNTAPDTTVDFSPNDPTNAAAIPFEFSSGDAGATFECSFAGGGFEACDSPKEYPGAGSRPDGDYVFEVRAVDEAGNRDDSPAERLVTLDTRAPEAPAIERPADGAMDNDGALVFSGTTEPGSRVRVLEFSGESAEVRATSRRAGEDGAWSVGFTGVPDGEHAFAAVATDAAGNESGRSGTRTVTVDTAPPEVVDVNPGREQQDVPINTNVKVVFSKKIDGSTLDGNFILTREREGSTVRVPAELEYDAPTNSATLRPEADLGYSEAYTATVRGGEDGVKDLAGSGLAADETWTFTTAEEPDTKAPDAPTIDRPGEEAHDDDGAFTLSGTAEPESRVRIFEAGGEATLVGAAFAGGDGAWSLDLAEVPEGRHVYEATATDASRNESGRSAGRAVVVDMTNPDTVIEASPASVTNETVTTFRFRSDEPGTTFECRPRDGSFEPCVSPQEYAGLSDGDYLFEVRATDKAGNTDPSPARRSFVVDTRAPEARLTSPAENALVSGEVRLTAEASDDRGVKRVEFLVDGKLVDSDLRGPYEFGWDSRLAGDGPHAVEVRVTDEAGNRATSEPRGIRADNTAPDTHITQSPPLATDGRDARFEFSSGDAGAAFECRMDDGPFEPCASPKAYRDLPEGRHLFAVRAVDEAGNRDDSPAERRIEVDATAPDVTIDAAPSGTTRDRTARIEFSSEAGARFSCSLDGAEFEGCTSPLQLTDLSGGPHTFRVRATDGAGNTGATAQRSWTVDTSTPDTVAPTVTKVAPTANRAFSRSVATAFFSEKLDPATVSNATFRLVKSGTRKPVAATVRYDAATNRAILKPARPLVRGSFYTATVTTGVKDAAGNQLAANKVWRFKVR